MADITQKQKLFCDEYIKTGNAELAAKKAGYNARGNTTKLLKNTTIAAYIKKRAEAQQKAEDRAIKASVDNGRIADMTEVKEFWSSLLRSKEVEPRDRLKASELIAKTNGAFIDRVEHSGNTGVTIINDIPRSKTK